jgi:hypothetical protein
MFVLPQNPIVLTHRFQRRTELIRSGTDQGLVGTIRNTPDQSIFQIFNSSGSYLSRAAAKGRTIVYQYRTTVFTMGGR